MGLWFPRRRCWAEGECNINVTSHKEYYDNINLSRTGWYGFIIWRRVSLVLVAPSAQQRLPANEFSRSPIRSGIIMYKLGHTVTQFLKRKYGTKWSPWWETTPLMWPFLSGARGGHIRGGPLYNHNKIIMIYTVEIIMIMEIFKRTVVFTVPHCCFKACLGQY